MLYLLFVLLFVILIGYVLWCYFKDKREIKKKTVESIGEDLWEEIDKERQESVEKGKQFRRVLKKVKENSGRR